jgi:hypothetical protein
MHSDSTRRSRLPNNPRSLSLSKQIEKFKRKKQKKNPGRHYSLQVADKKKTHSLFHFTPKVFPLTKELLPPSITSACRPLCSSSRRPPATPPPADKSDARHLHHQQPSTTVLNGPNATTHDPPSRGVNFLKRFFLLIFNSDRCYFIELMNLMAFNCVHIL